MTTAVPDHATYPDPSTPPPTAPADPAPAAVGDQRPGLIATAIGGALAGTVATLVMSAIMLPARWLGILGTQPPRRISDRLIDAAGGRFTTPEGERRIGTTIVHLAIGAIGGAGVAVVRRTLQRRDAAVVDGLAFGTGLWAVNYIVAAPALHLFAPPWADRPGRPPVMLAANALYGVVTTVLIDAFAGRRAR